MTSGGPYPVLRTIAVLYLIGAVAVLGLCVFQAIRVAVWGADDVSAALFGAAYSADSRVIGVVCWLAAGFLGLLSMLAVAELIKLSMDVVRNTRLALGGPAAAAGGAVAAAAVAGDDPAGIHEGPAVPLVGDRKLLEGDETAEGALLRGH